MVATVTPDVLVEALQGYIETLSDGSVLYYNAQGQLHRTGGPAAIHHNGTVAWYQNGELHREDGPALIRADGSRAWYQYYKRHRTDGPAVVRADGSSDWFLRGTCMSYTDFQRRAALEDCHDT